MSSIADQQLVLKNFQLQAQLDAQIQVNKKNEEMIAVYKKNEARAEGNISDLRIGAEHERGVLDGALADREYYRTKCNKKETEVESLEQRLEKQMEVATEIALLTPQEKDYLVKFVMFAVEKSIFQEDDPLTDIFKGRKARGWSTLDTSIIKLIIKALAFKDKFNLVIYHKFATKLKIQEDQRKAAAKRGLPVSAHSSPNPKKSPKMSKTDGEDFGNSSA